MPSFRFPTVLGTPIANPSPWPSVSFFAFASPRHLFFFPPPKIPKSPSAWPVTCGPHFLPLPAVSSQSCRETKPQRNPLTRPFPDFLPSSSLFLTPSTQEVNSLPIRFPFLNPISQLHYHTQFAKCARTLLFSSLMSVGSHVVAAHGAAVSAVANFKLHPGLPHPVKPANRAKLRIVASGLALAVRFSLGFNGNQLKNRVFFFEAFDVVSTISSFPPVPLPLSLSHPLAPFCPG